MNDSLKLDVVDILAQSHLNNRNYSQAAQLYRQSLNVDDKRPSGQINKLILGYAKTFFRSRDFYSCKDILLMSLDKMQSQEGFFPEVLKAISLRDNNDFNKRKRLMYLLAQTYKRLGDRQRELGVLNEILAENPQDKFALKRINS